MLTPLVFLQTKYNYCNFLFQLLLSKNSPWPMMKNGLLHSTPKNVTEKYPNLLELIEICAESSTELNRFKSSRILISTIENILEDKQFQNN